MKVLARFMIVIAFVAACSDTTEPSDKPAIVDVTPDTVTLMAAGATAQLSAAVFTQSGALISQPLVTWTSSNANVASVSSSGVVTAIAIGRAIVSARAGEATGSAIVNVIIRSLPRP